MRFHTYVPGRPLSDWIEDFWLYEDYLADHLHESILPSGTFELVFNLREDALRIYAPSNPAQYRAFKGAVISGPYAGAFMSDTVEERAILGVHFRPGGAFAMFGLPADDFKNRHVELRAVWGPMATALRDQLCALRDPADRFRLLEQALAVRLADAASGHPAVRAGLDTLVRSRGGAKVQDVADAVGLSRRRFVNVFAAEVGMTPKVFARIQRFQFALASVTRGAEPDWSQRALEWGYYDQSHLIRDFVQFCGLSPGDYLRRRRHVARAGIHAKRHHLPALR